MSRKRKTKGSEIQYGNCITKKLSTQREKDFAALVLAKKQERKKLSDKKRRFKTVPILNGYKLVEIKD